MLFVCVLIGIVVGVGCLFIMYVFFVYYTLHWFVLLYDLFIVGWLLVVRICYIWLSVVLLLGFVFGW